MTEQDRQVAILKRFLNTPASERPIKPDESDRLSNAYGEALIYLSEVLSAEPGNEDKSISDIRMGLRDTHPMLFKAGFSGDLAAAGAAAAEWEVLHCNVKGGGMKAAAKLAATRAPAAIKAMFERKGAK